MFVEDVIENCVNVILVNAITNGDFAAVKNRIGAKYEIINFSDNSIKFHSNWVPPLNFINSLSKSFPSLFFNMESEVDSRLACKSFHLNGLSESKEVPFYQKDCLKEFIWTKSM